MKAAILTELNKPLQLLADVEYSPPEYGQVLVKLAYSGVCHSQLMEARGRRGEDPYLPHLLGHEGSGEVLATGDGVTKVEIGDLVILGWIRGDGIDSSPPKYYSNHLSQEVNAGGVTTFNEYALVSENRIIPLPKGVPMDIAVLFGCAVPTGAGIVTNDLKPAPGSSVAVFGLGGIGLSALMATMLFENVNVIAVDISDEKLELAASFGAHHVVNASNCDPVMEIKSLTDGLGVDYAVEASGEVRVIEQAFDSIRRNGGLCVFASHPEQGSTIAIDPYELICGKQIRGSWGGNTNPDRDIPMFIELYLQGKLPLEKLLTRTYPLSDLNSALNDLEAHRVGRPLIEIDSSIGTTNSEGGDLCQRDR